MRFLRAMKKFIQRLVRNSRCHLKMFPLFLSLDILSYNGWPILTFPFVIVGFWKLVTGIGLVFLAVKGFQLPSFFGPSNPSDFNVETTKPEEVDDVVIMEKWRGNTLLWLICLFFFLFCGLDILFQSGIYTFGLCGPLGMHITPKNSEKTI